MSGENLGEIAGFVKNSLDFVSRYPACTYILRNVIEVMRRSENYALQDLGEELYNIWASSTSTVSCGIPVNLQIEFIKKFVGSALEIINKLNSHKEKNYLEAKLKFKREMEEFWNSRTISNLWKVKVERCPENNFNIPNIQHESKLSELLLKFITKHRIILYSEEPMFILRSGYRSFYFINPFHFISSILLAGDGNTKKKISEFEEFLGELFKEVRKKVNGNKIVTILFEKRFGEDPGTVVLSPILEELRIPSLVYDLESEYAWPKGPIFRRLNGSVDFEPIPIVDLTTTGGTARTMVRLIQNQLNKKPLLCPILISRGNAHLGLDGVTPLVILTWDKITESLGLTPEILKVSISSENEHMGYVWPSIYPFHDYLKDIYLYEKYLKPEREEILMDLEKEFRQKFEKFIEEHYNLNEKDGKAYLFEWYDTQKGKGEIINYLLSIHTFCWNHIYRRIFGEEDEDYLKEPLEYLLDSLELDENKKITVPFLPNLLEKKLKEGEYELELISPMDRIHRILVSNTEKIVNHIDKRLEEMFQEIDPPWGAVITKEQAEKIIEKKAERLIRILTDPEKDKEAFEKDLPKLREAFRKLVEEIYVKEVYKIMG